MPLGHTGDGLLHHQHLGPQLGGPGRCHQAGVAGSHHQDLSLQSLPYGALINLRSLPQPIRVRAYGDLLHHLGRRGHHRPAAGLGNTVGRGGTDGATGKTGSGDAVNGAALCVQHLLRQGVGGRGSHVRRLTAGVYHHIGDRVGVKSHGDGDGAVNSVGSAGVGAGNILSASSRSCSGLCRGSSGCGGCCCSGGLGGAGGRSITAGAG